MGSEAVKKESEILDATAETAAAVSASEAEKTEQPSAAEPNEASTLTDENRVSETTSDEAVVGTPGTKEVLAEEGGTDMSGNKQCSEVVGNAEEASQDKTTGSAGDETQENANEATEKQLNALKHTRAAVTCNSEDKETEVADIQDVTNLSPSQSTKRKLDNDSETKHEAHNAVSQIDKTSENNNAAAKPNTTLPKRPIKRARTAYFIFTDEKRPEVQAAHPGEGVAAVAKALGQMWGSLSAEEKKVYQNRAAKERERVSQELEAYKAAGGKDLDSPSLKAKDPLATILPVARIRKICKLDPEVRGLSKEALLLVTKCTELVLQKLGKETVKVAQLQNRRKLLPDDVAHVCAHREQFLFLKDDVKDLVRTMESSSDGKAGGAKKGDAAKQAAAAGTKKLTSYFSAQK